MPCFARELGILSNTLKLQNVANQSKIEQAATTC